MSATEPTEAARQAEISAGVTGVRARLDAAGGHQVRLIAVSKTFPATDIDHAVAAGIADIGENYAQEAVAKLGELRTRPTVHFIGQLQRNKVRKLAGLVDVWQTVDRIELAAEIAKRAPDATIMVQVDISAEEAKGGCPPDRAGELVTAARELGLHVEGLMGVAILDEPEAARPGFRLLRGLVDELSLPECSMGMSADLEIAVQEGATMVRVGRDIFGSREYFPRSATIHGEHDTLG